MTARWRYTVRNYGTGPGQPLVLETKHRTEASKDVEISASRARLARRELSYVEVIAHVPPYETERIYR